jgi:hypothetical protein
LPKDIGVYSQNDFVGRMLSSDLRPVCLKNDNRDPKADALEQQTRRKHGLWVYIVRCEKAATTFS